VLWVFLLTQILQVAIAFQRPAQQCYCTRIATRPFLEIGRACGGTLALKVFLLARNRVNSGVSQMRKHLSSITNRQNISQRLPREAHPFRDGEG